MGVTVKAQWVEIWIISLVLIYILDCFLYAQLEVMCTSQEPTEPPKGNGGEKKLFFVVCSDKATS